MAATMSSKNDLESTNPFPVASSIPPPSASAVSSLSGSGGIRKSTMDMKNKKKAHLRISAPPPAHHLRAIYDQKIAALEKEVNRLRNWWWVDMMDRPSKRDALQDGRWSEIYKREHWVRGMELAANGWVQADFARERMMQADMREKGRELRKAKEAAERAERQLAAAKVELARVRMELEGRREQDAIDGQLAATLLAAT